MRHIQMVRHAAISLCALALIGCGGGGGSAPSPAASSTPPPAAPPPPSGGASPASVPVPPSFAGPSVITDGAPGKFEGAKLPPGTAVTLVIRQPDGSERSQSVMVDAAGRMSHDITPGGSGVHSVRVLDASGRELATANFIGL